MVPVIETDSRIKHLAFRSQFLIFADDGVGLPIADAVFLVDDSRAVFYADAVGHFASGLCAAVAFAVGFAAYSEVLPQGAAVASVLAEGSGKRCCDGV